MKKVLFGFGTGSAFLLTPSLALAQGNLVDIITVIGTLIDRATPVIVALALLFFFWGLTLFILNQSNEEKKTEGRNIMIWGIIAIFVMLSVFGIVRILQNTFNVGSESTIPVPSIQRGTTI